MVDFCDTAIIDGAARITRDGYLVAEARVGRANNVQDYRAAELGLTDRDPNETVSVFRPESAVFAKDAMASLAHRPITINHPREDVTSGNWKALAVGDTGGDIIRDGDFLRVPLKVMDATAIRTAQTTHSEFSLGYSASLKDAPGEHDGKPYQFVMDGVRYNHLALVPAARGGSELRIVDERPASLRDHQEQPMKIKIGDAEVDATNGEAVSVAVKALDAKLTTLTTQNGELTKNLSDANAKVATLETEKATLTQQLADATLTPEKLRDAAKRYADVKAKGTALGVTVTDAMDETAIMKAVVNAKMGDAAKDWDDKQIAASFAVLAKDAGTQRHTAPSGAPINIGDAASVERDARQRMIDRMTGKKAA